MEPLNFKIKDLVQYVIYLITLIVFIVSMNNKVDNMGATLTEWRAEKKETGSESKANNQIIQNDLKALIIRAELNRANIELMKADIEVLKYKMDNIRR